MERKRIFISSTCYDLMDLRAELNEFLKDSGFETVLSDIPESDFKVHHTNSSIESCLINLRSCDAVIFILDQRYGGNLSNFGYNDISATHLEYREAIKYKMNILFYVRDKTEADYSIYKKSRGKIENDMPWIQKKDFGLFTFFDEHKKLTSKDKYNWYDTFKNSVELKNRIRKRLEVDITKNKFQKLLDSGALPFIDISLKKDINISSDSYYSDDDYIITFTNHGSSSALNTNFSIVKKAVYDAADGDVFALLFKNINYSIPSIRSNEAITSVRHSFKTFVGIPNLEDITYLGIITYTTVQGFRVADVIQLTFYSSSNVTLRYIRKEYLGDNAFETKLSKNSLTPPAPPSSSTP